MRDLTDIELGWLAGIIEGEGCFAVHRQKAQFYRKEYVYCRIYLASTDEWTVDRCLEISGVGTKYHRKGQQAHWKDQWRWLVNKQADVADVTRTVYPLLSPRRQDRARQVLERFSQQPSQL